ncbi:hypothetical protein [Streptomyces sp. NPDC093109]|uniref:hypothetical protein n=1 Tax=Streptomyces sp. NPDC093109 TaxID=3154977 RepID=UPI00344B65AA
MRPTIVLLSPASDYRELSNRLRASGLYNEGDIFDFLDRGPCRFSVDFSGDVIGEFDDGEIDKIFEKLGEFNAILIEYPGVACVRDLLMEVIPGVRGILDTNHGEFLGYDEVLERFGRDRDWDWRVGVS